MDSVAGTEASWSRAEAVRLAMMRGGLPAGSIYAHGFGNSRPIGPTLTQHERSENRRVEIVISGDAIGSTAVWDSSYRLTPR
jgi:flagellar motor protein MotB